MSLAVFALIAAQALFHLDPLPIHDEGAIDHIGMLLLFGQVPLIALGLTLQRRTLRKAFPAALLPIGLLGALILTVASFDHAARSLVAARINANVAQGNSETTLRDAIAAVRLGSDGAFDRGVRQFVSRERPEMQFELRGLGDLQSLTFTGVDRIGWDRFKAHFVNGEREWRLFVTPDGMIRGLTLQGEKTGCRSSEPYECRTPILPE
jgi:hypothetical protein